jgi:uncharacterized protein YecE (DUF72 family)
MRVRAGTSGFAYKEWSGTFYPPDLGSDGMLGYYASRFPTVEINNSFYRMPKESVLRDWAAQVPPEFTFCLKATRRITHQQRLKDVAPLLEYIFRTAAVLEEKQGPMLFQLPPFLTKDVPRLQAFLDGDLRAWADRIATMPWETAFVFFKHEEEIAGPAVSLRFLELAGGAG